MAPEAPGGRIALAAPGVEPNIVGLSRTRMDRRGLGTLAVVPVPTRDSRMMERRLGKVKCVGATFAGSFFALVGMLLEAIPLVRVSSNGLWQC